MGASGRLRAPVAVVHRGAKVFINSADMSRPTAAALGLAGVEQPLAHDSPHATDRIASVVKVAPDFCAVRCGQPCKQLHNVIHHNSPFEGTNCLDQVVGGVASSIQCYVIFLEAHDLGLVKRVAHFTPERLRLWYCGI